MKRTIEDWAVDIADYLLLGIVGFLTIYPMWYVLVISFNDGYDAMIKGIYFWPRVFSLCNYEEFFRGNDWIQAIFVSVARTIVGTFLTVIFTSMVSFAFSRRQLIGRKFYSIILIICMYFGGGLIPFYVTLRGYHLLNTFWVYVIPGMLNFFYVLVGRTFFSGIPEEMLEAAKVDGANDLKVFVRVVLPVSLPLLATMTLFIAVGQWNAWMDSAYYVQSNALRTLSYRLMEIVNKSTITKISQTAAGAGALAQAAEAKRATTFSLQCASLIVCVFPILCVYPFLQKYFVQGIMIGSVKG